MTDLITSILNDLHDRLGEEIIAIYGIGSYFDESLPTEWVKNDIDLVVVLKSLEHVPKKEWSTVRFERKLYGGAEVWISYTTLQGLRERERFERESFSNYAWSILDLKYPENSVFLSGDDIRDRLPDRSKIELDLDDVLRRSLYHLDRSFKSEYREGYHNESMRIFTKAVFKFGFYLCVFHDNEFYLTSIRLITGRVNKLVKEGKIKDTTLKFLEESIFYRRTHAFHTDFHELRTAFVEYIFSGLGAGYFHRKMDYKELKKFLETSFSGLRFLAQILKNAKKKHTRTRKNGKIQNDKELEGIGNF